MKKQEVKFKKVGRAVHRELFDNDSPYGHKVQRDRTKYKRVPNHKYSNGEAYE